MSDSETEILSMEKKLSYIDRLVLKFIDHSENRLQKFSLDEIEEIIRDFAKNEEDIKRSITFKFTFGKYREKLVKEVFNFDKPYLEWLTQQKMLKQKYPKLKAVIDKMLTEA